MTVQAHDIPTRHLDRIRCREETRLYRVIWGRVMSMSPPHAQHINEMLFGDVILLVDVPLQCGENVPLVQQIVSALPFQIQQSIIGNPVGIRRSVSVLWRYGKVLKLFAKNYDRLLRQQRVLGRRGTEVRGG